MRMPGAVERCCCHRALFEIGLWTRACRKSACFAIERCKVAPSLAVFDNLLPSDSSRLGIFRRRRGTRLLTQDRTLSTVHARNTCRLIQLS